VKGTQTLVGERADSRSVLEAEGASRDVSEETIEWMVVVVEGEQRVGRDKMIWDFLM
jgi:hypothetical protein